MSDTGSLGGPVEVTRRGAVAVVTMCRPPVNAFDVPMITALAEAFAGVRTSDASAILVFSSLPAFAAGADLREALDEAGAADRARRWRLFLESVRSMPVPVIAAVDGPCVGSGIGLITQCDLRLATDAATFSLPEITVGRAGGAAHLRRVVSEGRVRRMLLSAEPVDARTALAWGLVDELVAADAWPAAALAVTEQIAAHGRDALVMLKRALDLSELAGIEEGYAVEQRVTAEMRAAGMAHHRSGGS